MMLCCDGWKTREKSKSHAQIYSCTLAHFSTSKGLYLGVIIGYKERKKHFDDVQLCSGRMKSGGNRLPCLLERNWIGDD